MCKIDDKLLEQGFAAGGAPTMWKRAFCEMLPGIRGAIPPGSNVLEVGYGDGVLSCFLAKELKWKVTGLDISKELQLKASSYALATGVTDRVDFQYCPPEKTREHSGQYDAVFIKTVLYGSKDQEEYCAWLDWILSVLKPSGVFANFETGRANNLTQIYRRLRKRPYTDLSLYTRRIEELYDSRFEILERRYYGGVSQFFSPSGSLYGVASKVEEFIRPGNADNCFIVGMLARKQNS